MCPRFKVRQAHTAATRGGRQEQRPLCIVLIFHEYLQNIIKHFNFNKTYQAPTAVTVLKVV